jgi:hypothetical protein
MAIVYSTSMRKLPAQVLAHLSKFRAGEVFTSVDLAQALGVEPHNILSSMRVAVHRRIVDISVVDRLSRIELCRGFEVRANGAWLDVLDDEDTDCVPLEEVDFEAPFDRRWVRAVDVPPLPITGPISVFHLWGQP